jgi:hypothetical protein
MKVGERDAIVWSHFTRFDRLRRMDGLWLTQVTM